jgi:hypothetical protein
MTEYTTNPYRTNESPSKKVQERKLEAQSDWGELVRNQQALSEKMILQEREMKNVQRSNLQNSLQSQIYEKQNLRRNDEAHGKQQDFTVTQARQQDYENYLARIKTDQHENKRTLASDYSRQQWEREEEKKKKVEQDKLTDMRTVSDALDSLQREKLIKDRQRDEYKQSVQQLLRQKEEQKRLEQEAKAREREEHRRLMEENTYKLQAKDSNYKQYYQRVDEQQRNQILQHDRVIGDQARNRNRQIDDFINKGVEEARLKAEREELEKQAKKQEQLRSMKQSVQNKIQENEHEKRVQKMSYQNKVEDLLRQNVQMQSHQDMMKQHRANQVQDYKQTLEQQMRESEDLKKRQQSNMLDHEKKILLGDGLIPGVRSSKVDALNNPQMRVSNLLGQIGGGNSAYTMTSPTNQGAYTMPSPTNQAGLSPLVGLRTSSDYGGAYAGRFDTVASPKYQSNLNNQSADYIRPNAHNPITNPMNAGQNPYINRDNQRGSYNTRTTLAGSASNNIFGH